MFLAQFHLGNRIHQGNQLFLCNLRLNQKRKNLIDFVSKKVLEKTGIKLEKEIKILE